MIVFTVRNKVTGQVYVGSTSLSLEERWSQLVSSIHTSLDYPLYNDIREHGEGAFELNEWAVADSRAEARDLETEAIEAENALSLRGYKTAATLRSELKASDIDKAVDRMLEELRTPPVFERERPVRQDSRRPTPPRSGDSSVRQAPVASAHRSKASKAITVQAPTPQKRRTTPARTVDTDHLFKKEKLEKRLSSSKEKRIREAIKAEKEKREAEKRARIAAEQDEMAAILARLDARTKVTSKLHRKL